MVQLEGALEMLIAQSMVRTPVRTKVLAPCGPIGMGTNLESVPCCPPLLVPLGQAGRAVVSDQGPCEAEGGGMLWGRLQTRLTSLGL